MLKKIVLTAAAVSLFAIPSVALSSGGPEISDLMQNAETDDLTMKSTYDMGVVQGGNVALGGDVKEIEQDISGDDLNLTMKYATAVVQAANVIGGTEIKGALQNASFDKATMTSDSNLGAIQAINAATSCVNCDN